MEIEGEDGSRIKLEAQSRAVFGRGSGFNTKDRTVSRRHVQFQLQLPLSESGTQTGHTLLFEVVGKNPIWVRRRSGVGTGYEVKVFGELERGEVAAGDWFCVSSRDPVWFKVKKKKKRIEVNGGEGECDLSGDFENVDVSKLDTVKEFGFLVVGHEFDCYPKQRIRDAKNWDWFLEESEREEGGDDEGERKRRKRKKKRGGDNEEDEDWTGESEDDENIVMKTTRIDKPKYLTRSKDKKGGHQDSSRKKDAGITKKVIRHREEDEEEEEEDDDETLGGFIVDDDSNNVENVIDECDEEEEEFLDDEDEDD